MQRSGRDDYQADNHAPITVAGDSTPLNTASMIAAGHMNLSRKTVTTPVIKQDARPIASAADARNAPPIESAAKGG